MAANMGFELDHLFICTSSGAPAAEHLLRFGLREGPPNQHPGQGTACRRFSFQNAMIELLWVSDAQEAQSGPARRSLLWERWSGRETRASPFGICLRPDDSPQNELPFPAWEYRPAYLPDPLLMHIGHAGVDEPMWIYLDFMLRAQREHHFIAHPAGTKEITGLILNSPTPLHSAESQIIVKSGILSTREGSAALLEIEFDRCRRNQLADFRPHLPLVFRF